MNQYQLIKQSCYKANMQLPKLNLVVFTFGNVSVVDREKAVFAIKPSGVPYDELTVEGTMRPSSDTKTHAVLYKYWTDIGAIVHTHSTYATAWAQTQRDIPILGTTHADHLTVDVPCAPPMDDAMIRGDYEHETGFQIMNEFERRGYSHTEVEMVLLSNHAPFTWGKTAEKAVYNSAVLEAIAQMAYLTCTLDPSVSRLKNTVIEKHYERKHGKNAYYGQV
jgi:L-ribulose-5-phosphate 4-epimerase